MVREIPHWTLFEICKVTLDSGVVGFGETMVYYTWGADRVSDEAKAKVVGKHPAENMWDDSLGAGLQIALFDAAAKILDAPLHQMLGRQIRDRCHISWWDIDLPADDWIAECKTAIEHGYTSFKTKGRPGGTCVSNAGNSANRCPIISKSIWISTGSASIPPTPRGCARNSNSSTTW